MVLILSHICTLSVFPNMIKISDGIGSANHESVPRGVVSGFSKAARKRMLELLNQLTFERIAFVTLTYPAEFPLDGREYKKHLRRFRARMERKYPKIRVLWRLEFQRRGAPHFHLLLFDAPFLCKFCLSYDWYKSVGSGDKKHLRRGTNIKGVASKGENGKIISYVAKYAAKPLDPQVKNDDTWTGRYYGRWNVETPTPIEFEIDLGGAIRVAAGALSLRGRGASYVPNSYSRCTLFGGSMGSDEFGSVLGDSAESIGGRKRVGKLDS